MMNPDKKPRKGAKIEIRLTKEEKDAIRARAHKDGYDERELSEWARRKLKGQKVRR